MTNNNVTTLIPLRNDEAVLAAGKSWMELADGQIGVFDTTTNLSIDGTKNVNRISLQAGFDTGSGSIDTLRRSSGFEIQTNRLRGYTLRKYQPAGPQKFLFSNLVGTCDSTYSIHFKGWNDEIFRMIGWQGYKRSYIITTPCNPECSECTSCNNQQIAPLLADKINADKLKAFTAVVLDEDGAVVADPAAYQADNANDGKPLNLEVTSVLPGTMQTTCNIPYNYVWPRVKSFEAAIGIGFDCNGKVEETQELTYEQNSLADIRYKEYYVEGWRNNNHTKAFMGGQPKQIQYLANAPKYDVIWLDYTLRAQTGWDAEEHDLATMIAIPSTDSTTLASLIGVLDKIFAREGFDTLADDIALQSSTGTDISAIDNPDKDGIG